MHQSGLFLFARCLMRPSLEILDRNVSPMQKCVYRKPHRYSTGCCMAALCSRKKGYFIEPAPRSARFPFILLYFGRYAYTSSAVCQIYDCAWQNYTRNYFGSM